MPMPQLLRWDALFCASVAVTRRSGRDRYPPSFLRHPMKDALSRGEVDAFILKGRSSAFDRIWPAHRIQWVGRVRSTVGVRREPLGVSLLGVEDDTPNPVDSLSPLGHSIALPITSDGLTGAALALLT